MVHSSFRLECYMFRFVMLFFAVLTACGGASDQLEMSQKLMNVNGLLDATGQTGCLADCRTA